ncbi:hypothetical protein FIBSPDRAFT_874068 [Athelia psychrophila]|uniref:Uncharacterized protein n=1 Tax=Athelia psychrophila TaxID=1759441 RepID=A0A165XUA3_9AGAM|nr:hypothetical protein FIBSPDRAFT_874068 [Fibularhizoctonia sp. CBS 109695]
MHPFANWSMQPPARPRALKQIIQALDPSRLRPSDYLNLAGAGQPMISIQNTYFMPSYTSQPGRNPLSILLVDFSTFVACAPWVTVIVGPDTWPHSFLSCCYRGH